MDAGYNPRTAEEVFRDYKGRRAGLTRALTTGRCRRFARSPDWLFSPLRILMPKI
jgi:hypothetical protein